MSRKSLSLFLYAILFLFCSLTSHAFSMRYHYDLIRGAMQYAGFSEDAIDLALASNAYTDIMQEPDPTEYVMDNDFVAKGAAIVDYLHCDQLYNKDMVDKYFRRLIYNMYKTLQVYLTSDSERAMAALGTALHIIQDFYAHSNWADLGIESYAGIKDATFFDVMVNKPSAISLAGMQNKLMSPQLKEWQVYTNGNGNVPTPNHDSSHKDNWGRNYFDWAFREAYKSSVEWVLLCKKWVCTDFGRPDIWASYSSLLFSGNRDELHTLASYDEGTFRYLYTYAGSWSHKEKWPKNAIFMDNLPNVSGIGWLEGNGSTGDVPLMGDTWYDGTVRIADRLFQTQSVGTVDILYFNGSDATKTSIPESSIATPTDSFVGEAYQYLANCLSGSEYPVDWLQVSIPYVRDLDPGDGWFNINNEEGGDGTYSDYWPAITLNGVYYSEALLWDRRDASTFWGVLMPLWNYSPVSLNIKLYESDSADHHDEIMDTNPSSGEKEVNQTLDPTAIKAVAGGVSQVWAGTDNEDWGAEIDTLYKVLPVHAIDPATISNIPVLYKTGDAGAPSDNHIKPHLKLQNDGTAAVALKDLTVRYWYTSEGSQTQNIYVDYAAVGNNNIVTSFHALDKQRFNADGYLEVGFTTQAGNLAPGANTGEIQLRCNKQDWKNYNELNDYSYIQNTYNYIPTTTVTVYKNGKLVWGAEPRTLKPEEYPVGIAKVWMKDEAYGQNQNVTLRLYVENIGNGVLDNFDAYYYFTTENGKTPVMTIIEKYYTPNVGITLENLGGADYRIDFKFTDANIAPGDVSPNRDGFSVGIHYSDWSAMDDTNDKSYPGSGTFVSTGDVTVTNYDSIKPAIAKYRKTLTVNSLHCDQTEDSGEDEASLYIDADGVNIDLLTKDDMNEPNTWDIGKSYNFSMRAKFRLYDRDGDFPGDDDDALGEATVNLTEGTFDAKFTEDDANYTLNYTVGPYVPSQVALKRLTVKRVICNDTLYSNSTDAVTLGVTSQASSDYSKTITLRSGKSYVDYSDHFFYVPTDSATPATITLMSSGLGIISKAVETADGNYTVSGTDYSGSYQITYSVTTVGYKTPIVQGLETLFKFTLQKLECIEAEDYSGDEARLKIYLDGVEVETKNHDIDDNQVWDINTVYIFENKVAVNLTDLDDPWLGDDDDDLGTAEVMASIQENYYVISSDGAIYRLYYKVEQAE
jgi:hypothetical protein